MDEIGLRYLLLALRLGRHLPDFVSSFIGPAEIAETIAGEEPAPAEELHQEALSLHAAAAELAGAGARDDGRRRWLADQLTAIAASARLLAGEGIALVDLVEELYAIPAEAEPDATFASAQRVLEDALPAGGSLAERLEAHERSVTLPAAAVVRAVRRMTTAMRQRTIRDVWLPEGESVQFVVGGAAPGGLTASYLGGLQTRVVIGAEQTVSLGVVVQLAGHEGYPGHHAERATKEALLVRERGLGEAMVSCRYTPEEAISEGLADAARGLVLSDQELGAVLHRLVRDLGLPMPAVAIEREVIVARARLPLRRATANAALMLERDAVPARDVRAWLADASLLGERQVDEEMGRLGTLHGRVRAFSHLAGPRVVAEWLEGQGQTRGLGRLLSEQLTPGQLRAEAGEGAG